MTICSLVVYAKPENTDAVEQRLAGLAGIEIHATDPGGKLVVTVDHADRRQCSETIMGLSAVPGVINTALVYEYHE